MRLGQKFKIGLSKCFESCSPQYVLSPLLNTLSRFTHSELIAYISKTHALKTETFWLNPNSIKPFIITFSYPTRRQILPKHFSMLKGFDVVP